MIVDRAVYRDGARVADVIDFQASIAQGEQVQKLSAWAAILFAPTLVGTVYGMNFHDMPELGWRLGYPMALLAMLAVALILYAVFRRKRWI